MPEPPVLVCDFDGTLTTVDVGDALCERFAPPRWAEIDRQWLRGEITLPEAQREMWALVRATEEELVAHARAVGTFRKGADRLFDAAAAGRLKLVIASGGFELYIHALLGERRAAVHEIVANRLEALPSVPGAAGGAFRPVFRPGAGCERVAVCKARVIRRYLRSGHRVAFCGDGSSDRCAAGVAPELFTVPGGMLTRHCNDRGIAHVCTDDLGPIVEALCSG